MASAEETMTVQLGRDASYLVVFDGGTSRQYHLPDKGEVIIGRADDANLQLQDASVSRHHAKLLMTKSGATLVDLGSHNGVLLNGERITADQLLDTRDVIAIGEVTLIFHGVAGEARPAKPAPAARRIEMAGRTAVVADPAMLRLYQLLERLSGVDLPVLIGGETGTGKELAAAAVHHFSPRRSKPFVALNCAALPETLAESELFGHERGAFTGANVAKAGLLESASGGTVFLDEVGEVSAAIQAKLLRVLETRRVMRLGDVKEREIDIRIVAATNRDLEAEVKAGRFRQDLYFRLSGATVWLPPLRDRGGELMILAREILADLAHRADRTLPGFTDEVEQKLLAYPWPGNIRELRNVLQYMLAMANNSPRLGLEHLPDRVLGSQPLAPVAPVAAPPPPSGFRPVEEELRELEKSRMVAALAACDGNQTQAAELIGMPRRTFVAKMKLYGLRD